ncbi:MAG: chorismate synthase [Oscillospiraceae bacterium]|nr:chorismate synthase [Oscillospiraceae bacterium]
MSSDFGKMIRVSLFGESHSAAIGAVISGVPAGEYIDIEAVDAFMARRAPGQGAHTTSRREADRPVILSGIADSVTTGTPIAAMIENGDARPSDYVRFSDTPRPSHADYPALMKYGAAHDIRGGGHFSGRLTAPLCFAGAVCKQILARRGITVGAHIASVGAVRDEPFDPVGISAETLSALSEKSFTVLSGKAGERMLEEIRLAKEDGDSVGGVIECAALGLPPGVGEPIFDGVENRLAAALFGIPAVKGVEFGAGFKAAAMRGSEHNDGYVCDGGTVRARTNNGGGIAGGLTTGMPVIFRAAFKPTPSIAREQRTVNLREKKNAALIIGGRHDPCVVPRAVPCVEAAAAIVLLDLILEHHSSCKCESRVE